MNKQENISESVAFEFTSRVVPQLGRQSISDSIIAIIELIKNSFDADADNVWIRFRNLNLPEDEMESIDEEEIITPPPYLVVEDDGDGMTSKEIKNIWMVIGVDNKAKNRISAKNRTKVGEKGLGRLGLDSLGGLTTLFTFPKSDMGGATLEVDWRKYDDSSLKVHEIKHPLFDLESNSYIHPVDGSVVSKSSGTVLVVQELRNKWAKDTLDSLRKQLSLLVSPFGGTNDFHIWLDLDGEIQEVTSSAVLDAAVWSVFSEIRQTEGEWYIYHDMEGNGLPDQKFKGKWSDVFPEADKVPHCGELEFILYFMPRITKNDDQLSFSSNEIKTFLDNNQGVRVYRDSFRVHPYGDPEGGEGDWLGLAHRRQQSPQGRRQGGWKVGYNQVFGAVFLERERNSNLLDQTNREGLLKGQGYSDLKRYALHAISWFEVNDTTVQQSQEIQSSDESDSGKAKQELDNRSRETESTLEELDSIVDHVFDDIQTKLEKGERPDLARAKSVISTIGSRAKTNVRQTRSAQSKFERVTDKEKQLLELQRDYMANLASLGILSVSFGHETLRQVNLVVTGSRNLKDSFLDSMPALVSDPQKEILDRIDLIHRYSTQISSFAEFMLKNVERDNRRRVKTDLREVVQNIFSVFDPILVVKRKIDIQCIWPETLPWILAFRIDWESVFINLITNSEKALQNVPGNKRKIRVTMENDDELLRIKFADSGTGLEVGEHWVQKDIDNFFRPNVSTRRNDFGDVTGTGMGLFIIKQIIDRYKGDISAVPRCELGGAEFTISIPYPKRGNNA